MKNLFLLNRILILIFLLLGTHALMAVAFKLENGTSASLRATVYDRGGWRNYIQVNPGQCKDIETDVERTEHGVKIEMLTSNGWQQIYSHHHGSRFFTRLVYVTEDANNYFFKWYDEHPGCRDCASTPNTCLKGPFVTWSNAIKLGKFLGKTVLMAEGAQ